jgi:aminoglycoside 6'-N-acetyltransferase I
MANVRIAQPSDRTALAKMRASLWPKASFEDHLRELDASFGNVSAATLPAVTLVSCDHNGKLAGFLEVGLRSHADGCDPRRPVGYVEGWFVDEAFRNQGIGGELMRAAEAWARSHGCLEMASDVLIDNHGSQRAHETLGFEVVDRCVHFRKNL